MSTSTVSDLPDDFDMGRETSRFLDEIRTVLSRAKTARKYIGDNPKFYIEYPQPIFGQRKDHQTRGEFLGYSDGISVPHPGAAEGIKALDDLIEALEPFARTGKTIKR